MHDLLSYYNDMKDHSIQIAYSGPISSDGIEGVAATLRRCLKSRELPLSASQAVFSVFVELMNNVLMYSRDREPAPDEDEKNRGASRGIFVLRTRDKSYFLQSGNKVRNENIDLIKNRLDHVNGLDKNALRQYYREMIKCENDNPESLGGGLGLIEIARRSSSKIEYAFTPMEDGFSFYSMTVKIL